MGVKRSRLCPLAVASVTREHGACDLNAHRVVARCRQLEAASVAGQPLVHLNPVSMPLSPARLSRLTMIDRCMRLPSRPRLVDKSLAVDSDSVS